MTDDTTERDAAGTVAFAYEMGVLKRMPGAGWWHVGVRDPESVAEHSLRVAQLAALIGSEEGGDPARALYLGLWHDSQETRIGDLPHSATVRRGSQQRADHRGPNRGPSRQRRQSIRDAVTEYEANETIEARCVKDADRLECLMQAVEYGEAGYKRVDGWIESSRARLQTPFAHRRAQAALHTSPLTWRDRIRSAFKV